MDDVQSIVSEKVSAFIKKLEPHQRFDFKIRELDIGRDVRGTSDWSSWAEKVGIYVFIGKDKIHYIGRALKGTNFGKRIADQIAPRGDESAKPWQDIVNSGDTKILLVAFNNIDDDYWAASLEIFLIDAFWEQVKEFNKKRG